MATQTDRVKQRGVYILRRAVDEGHVQSRARAKGGTVGHAGALALAQAGLLEYDGYLFTPTDAGRAYAASHDLPPHVTRTPPTAEELARAGYELAKSELVLLLTCEANGACVVCAGTGQRDAPRSLPDGAYACWCCDGAGQAPADQGYRVMLAQTKARLSEVINDGL